jgi:hypothetical protein
LPPNERRLTTSPIDFNAKQANKAGSRSPQEQRRHPTKEQPKTAKEEIVEEEDEYVQIQPVSPATSKRIAAEVAILKKYRGKIVSRGI